MDEYKPPTADPFRNDKIYDVFLSFRGPDVRKTLADTLYRALRAKGLEVFIDSDHLEAGREIWPNLERSIANSAVRIPIFSKGYADSVWCLKEAAAMSRTPGLIIPLFYDVEASHVRYPENDSSAYKKSFEKHYGHPDRYPKEEVDGWKNALHKISNLKGWPRDVTQGYEGRLVETVVNDVLKALGRVPLDVAKNLLVQKLDLKSADEVRIIGIYGMGGIEKTTLAKGIYEKARAHYEASSFISNVCTSAAKPSGLINLQRQLLEDLTKYDGQVHSVDEGKSLLKERVAGIRVLLVLDDVDDVSELDALVGNWLAPGSGVVITSRQNRVIKAAQPNYTYMICATARMDSPKSAPNHKINLSAVNKAVKSRILGIGSIGKTAETHFRLPGMNLLHHPRLAI